MTFIKDLCTHSHWLQSTNSSPGWAKKISQIRINPINSVKVSRFSTDII